MQQPEQERRNAGSWELKLGVPVAGQEGPPGATFIGWVLVQAWEPSPTSKDGMTVHVSGDPNGLLPAASRHLAHLHLEFG